MGREKGGTCAIQSHVYWGFGKQDNRLTHYDTRPRLCKRSGGFQSPISAAIHRDSRRLEATATARLLTKLVKFGNQLPGFFRRFGVGDQAQVVVGDHPFVG